MSVAERVTSFLKDVRVESRKITFPTRKELQESTLVVLITIAGNGHSAKPKHRPRFTGIPHLQPSLRAIGLPSSTMFGVATQVLRKSIPRASNSNTNSSP